MRNQFLILTILLFCIGTAQATVVYQEDFEDDSADGITIHNAGWSISPPGINSDTGYHASSGENIFTLDNILSDNVWAGADFKITFGSGDFEIWVNATIKENQIESGYVIAVHPHGGDNTVDRITRIDPGGNQLLDDIPTGNVYEGSEYNLKVGRLGDEIKVILNDSTEILSVTDSTYHNGLVGFRFYGTGIVDNVAVTPEPATMALLGLGALVLRRKHRA